MQNNTFLKLFSVVSLALLAGCGARTSGNTISQAIQKPSESPDSTAVAESAATQEQKDTADDARNRTTGLTGLLSAVVPDGWEQQIDGYDSPYEYLNEDRIILKKGEGEVVIEASLQSYPVGIGGDQYSEGTYQLGEFEYQLLRDTPYDEATKQNNVDETSLKLCAGGYLGYTFNGYGILTISYSNPNGAYLDDIRSLVESVELKDSYGTATVLADKINIRNGLGTDKECLGSAKKGETYKVRAVQGDGTYTWYAIGWQNGDPNGGEFKWIADKDADWVSFKES